MEIDDKDSIAETKGHSPERKEASMDVTDDNKGPATELRYGLTQFGSEALEQHGYDAESIPPANVPGQFLCMLDCDEGSTVAEIQSALRATRQQLDAQPAPMAASLRLWRETAAYHDDLAQRTQQLVDQSVRTGMLALCDETTQMTAKLETLSTTETKDPEPNSEHVRLALMADIACDSRFATIGWTDVERNDAKQYQLAFREGAKHEGPMGQVCKAIRSAAQRMWQTQLQPVIEQHQKTKQLGFLVLDMAMFVMDPRVQWMPMSDVDPQSTGKRPQHVLYQRGPGQPKCMHPISFAQLGMDDSMDEYAFRAGALSKLGALRLCALPESRPSDKAGDAKSDSDSASVSSTTTLAIMHALRCAVLGRIAIHPRIWVIGWTAEQRCNARAALWLCRPLVLQSNAPVKPIREALCTGFALFDHIVKDFADKLNADEATMILCDTESFNMTEQAGKMNVSVHMALVPHLVEGSTCNGKPVCPPLADLWTWDS